MAGSPLASSEDPGPLGLSQSLLISVQLTEVILKFSLLAEPTISELSPSA